MPGEHHLETLLAQLNPVLDPEAYVFCTLEPKHSATDAELTPFASVQEPEGLSLVLSRAQAEASGLEYHGTFRCMRLDVHSSLESVGLTAAVSTALAKEGISANVIAGTFHDYVLVPESSAARAMHILGQLSAAQSSSTSLEGSSS